MVLIPSISLSNPYTTPLYYPVYNPLEGVLTIAHMGSIRGLLWEVLWIMFNIPAIAGVQILAEAVDSTEERLCWQFKVEGAGFNLRSLGFRV